MKFTDQEWAGFSEWVDQALKSSGPELEELLNRLPESCPVPKSVLRDFISTEVSRGTVSFLNCLPNLWIAADGNLAPAVGPGTHCGGYRLVAELGHGGMAEVWLAERTDGLVKRPVALKLPHAGIQATEFARRAHRERDILASLSHPGIARLYDAGVEVGRPYLVLEFIEGIALDRFCDQHQLSIEARLRLFIQILISVQYAHANLVIHGDLKPSNILVTSEGQVKLLDFGIARLVSSETANDSDVTQTAARVLTPAYAAPEQITGERITTACDIYSLGVVLFELLSGDRPRVANGQIAAESDPRQLLPSRATRDEGKAQARSSTGKNLRALLKGDLDSITSKALDSAPAGRYATADAFRADIEHYLAGEPVTARPERFWYRVRKFVRRHRLPVAAVAATVVALVVGLGVALWEAGAARREARTSAAVQKFIKAIFETNSREQKDPVKARQTTARQLLDSATRNIDTELNNAPAAKEKMLEILADLYGGLGLDDQAVALSKRRVTVAKAVYGQNDLRTASALSSLGTMMHASRSVNERQEVLLQAKRILDANRDFSSHLRGDLLNALSQHYQSTDRQKSLEYAGQAVALFRRLQAPNDLAGALYYQGLAYAGSENKVEAEASLSEALSISRRAAGELNPDLPLYAAHLGEANASLVHYQAAKSNFELAYRVARAINGDEHVDSIETESRLGLFLTQISEFSDGLRHLKHALDVCLKINGPDDPFYTPQMRFQYGQALASSGHPEEALEQTTKAIENRRKNRPGTRYLGQMLTQQALELTDLGEYDKARQYLDEAAEISQKVGFPTGLDYAAVRLRIAFHLKQPGEAAAIIEKSYGAGPDSAPVSQKFLKGLTASAQLALLEGRSQEALGLAERVSSAVRASPNRGYLKVWEAGAALQEGDALLQIHQPYKALALLQRAVQLQGEIYDEGSVHLLQSKVALAAAYLETGDRPRSAELRAQVYVIRRKHGHLGDTYETPLWNMRRDVGKADPHS